MASLLSAAKKRQRTIGCFLYGAIAILLLTIGMSLGGAAAILSRSLGADALVVEAPYTTIEEAVTNRLQVRF